MSKEKIFIFDTTLRDGAQTEGVNFSIDDKNKIAKVLSNASTQNRSFGSIESGTSSTVKDHNSVTAEAMFVDFATALGKITVT